MTPIIIYTDGSCSKGYGGWGYFIRYTDSVEGVLEVENYGAYPKKTTNNVMELQAAVEALRFVSSPSDIILYSDSEYLIKGITEWINKWKVNHWTQSNKKKKVANRGVWKELDKLNRFHNITWKWVKGHSGDIDNDRVDRLAKLGMYKARMLFREFIS